EPRRRAVAGSRGRPLFRDSRPGLERRRGADGSLDPPRGQQGGAGMKGKTLVLKGGRVIDPANGVDGVHDVVIADGKIERVAAAAPAPKGAEVVDVTGKIVCPGFIDIPVHLHER